MFWIYFTYCNWFPRFVVIVCYQKVLAIETCYHNTDREQQKKIIHIFLIYKMLFFPICDCVCVKYRENKKTPTELVARLRYDKGNCILKPIVSFHHIEFSNHQINKLLSIAIGFSAISRYEIKLQHFAQQSFFSLHIIDCSRVQDHQAGLRDIHIIDRV